MRLLIFILFTINTTAQCNGDIDYTEYLAVVDGVGIGNDCGDGKHIVANVYGDMTLEGLLSLGNASVIVHGDTISAGGWVRLRCSEATFTVLGTLDVDEKEKRIFTIYPNPTNTGLFVEGRADKIEIYSLKGSKILETPKTDNMIDISFLSSGMYIIIASDVLGNKSNRKLIIK